MKPYKLSNDVISIICMELSLLLHAGISTGDSLSLLAQSGENTPFRPALEEMSRSVDDGTTMSAAFSASELFPHYVCALVGVGERTGKLEEALSALSAYYENRSRMARRLRSALLYPSMLLLIMVAVIVILLARVLPIFDEVYSYLGGSLTGIAGGLLIFGQALDRMMPALCGLLGVIVLFLALFASSQTLRGKMLSLWQRRFGNRGVSFQLNTARFAQALSMGLSSGLPMEESISLAGTLLDTAPSVQVRCSNCLTYLEAGRPLPQAMDDAGVLPSDSCRMLDFGIRSGSGDQAMEQISRRLAEESEAALESRLGQVEPTLVMITSGLVGLILLSVMLPLMNIMTAIG